MSVATVDQSVTESVGEHALPAVAAPTPQSPVLIGTALACLAGSTLIGGMLAVWILLRERVLGDTVGGRFPVKYIITEVASNVMLMTLFALCLFAQWAIYAAKRGDRAHTAVALGVVALLGIAYINAQAFVWTDMGVEIDANYYGALFYAVTGTMVALVAAGLLYTTIVAFRALGGRLGEIELITAHALYWYFVAAAYTAVWFVVYVTK